jgi:hypothetical protein
LNLLTSALVSAVVVVACEDASTPVDPVWGKQACASCAMVVSDPRFASEVGTREGARLFFDDPGCMASWVRMHGGEAEHAWVRSAAGPSGGSTWIDAHGARFVRGQQTPMGYGFAPAESGDAAWSDVEAEAARRAAPERRLP